MIAKILAFTVLAFALILVVCLAVWMLGIVFSILSYLLPILIAAIVIGVLASLVHTLMNKEAA